MKNTFELLSKSQRSIWAAVFLFSGLLFSCKKEVGDLGLNVLPDQDLLNAKMIDTLSLVTYSIVDDSLRTDELSNTMLGSYVDPIFGKTTMSMYTQLRLSANNPTFDVPNIVVDSVVLSLVYGGYYGALDNQSFRVYEVLDTMYKDSSYNSSIDLNTDPTDLVMTGFNTVTPNVVSYVYLPDGDSARPQMRLRLDNSVGQRIINESGTGNLADNDAFSKFFKGLYVFPDNPSQNTGQGAVFYMDVLNEDSKMTIYYRDLALGDTLAFDLLINDFCARYTRADHDYSGTMVEAQLNDSTLGQQFFYMQAGAGLEASIRIPNLDKLKDLGNIVINKAELVLPVQYYSTDPYTPQSRLLLYGEKADGSLFLLRDDPGPSVTNSSFGGSYIDTEKSVTFLVGRHLQEVLRGSLDNVPLRLASSLSGVSANRMILSGQQSPNRDKPYIRIYYTKY